MRDQVPHANEQTTCGPEQIFIQIIELQDSRDLVPPLSADLGADSKWLNKMNINSASFDNSGTTGVTYASDSRRPRPRCKLDAWSSVGWSHNAWGFRRASLAADGGGEMDGWQANSWLKINYNLKPQDLFCRCRLSYISTTTILSLHLLSSLVCIGARTGAPGRIFSH